MPLKKQAQEAVSALLKSLTEELVKSEEPYTEIAQAGYQTFNFHHKALTLEAVRAFKSRLLEVLALPKDTKIVQIIDDCPGTFDGEAQLWVKKELQKRVVGLETSDDGKPLYLYGTTGKKANKAGIPAMGTNTTFAQVLELLEGAESDISERVVGNVVNGGTTMVIDKFGCIVSGLVKTLLHVWSEEGAKFGADTLLSDNLLGKGDTVICLEGGPQSFAQLLTLVANDCNIEVFDNLRGTTNPDCRTPDGEQAIFLSASSFVKHIQSCEISSKQTALQAVIDYVKLPEAAVKALAEHSGIEFSTLTYPTAAERLYANVSNYDYDTKFGQIMPALENFLKLELWTKIQSSQVQILGTFSPTAAVASPSTMYPAAASGGGTTGASAAASSAIHDEGTNLSRGCDRV